MSALQKCTELPEVELIAEIPTIFDILLTNKVPNPATCPVPNVALASTRRPAGSTQTHGASQILGPRHSHPGPPHQVTRLLYDRSAVTPKEFDEEAPAETPIGTEALRTRPGAPRPGSR